MKTIPISIAGQTGGHRSKQFNSELTQNMYLDISGERKAAVDFPGLKVWAQKAGKDRGWHVMDDVLYKLIDDTLYKINSAGVYVAIPGKLPGTGWAVFADDGTNLYFAVQNGLYKYDGVSVTKITQTVVTNPKSVDYINRQFILSGINGVFGTSDPGDGDTYNALNFAEAEVRPDHLVRAYVFSQLVYMLGFQTTEVWYNTGSGNPPFARQDSSLVNVGIAGKLSATNTDRFLYWLGNDRKVYQCTGVNARNVATLPISHMIEGFSYIQDCRCSSFVLEGQDFVLFDFPTANKTLLYSETFDYWVELANGTDMPGDKWYGGSVIRCYDKNLVSCDGDVLELDLETYTDNGQTRLRVRTLPNFSGAMIGADDKRITVGRVRVNMQLGVGLATGQGSAPVLMCQFSPDGGETWEAQHHVDIGAMGDYFGPVDFYDFTTGYDVRCRIMCSDPVFLSMFDGAVDIEAAGY